MKRLIEITEVMKKYKIWFNRREKSLFRALAIQAKKFSKVIGKLDSFAFNYGMYRIYT